MPVPRFAKSPAVFALRAGGYDHPWQYEHTRRRTRGESLIRGGAETLPVATPRHQSSVPSAPHIRHATPPGAPVSLPPDGVCFYPDKNYQGTAVCAVWGQDQPRVNSAFGSVRILGSVRVVELFESANYQGRSLRLTSDLADLSRASAGFFGTPATWAPNLGSFRMGQ